MNTFIVIGTIVLVLLAWGFIGSSQAAEIGTSCDIGIGDDGNALCWTWHRNIVGDIQDNFGDIINK